MRLFRCIAVGLLLVGLPAGVSADHHEGLIEEVRAIGDQLTEMMLADDIDAMLTMYLEDAISLPNFSPRMDGVEAFRANHAQMAAAGMKVTAFESDPVDAWEVADHVIEIGNYEITMQMPGMPAPIEDKGKYMTVYVRGEDGSLKVKIETWNTDMNPMGMGAPGG